MKFRTLLRQSKTRSESYPRQTLVMALERRVLLSGSVSAVATISAPTITSSNWLTMDHSGNVYGSSFYGGPNNTGFIYEIAAGTTAPTILATLPAPSGGIYNPQGLVVDGSGNVFGITSNDVFELPAGSSTATSVATNVATLGNIPGVLQGVVMDSSGNLFFAANAGGDNGLGSIDELPSGGNTITVVASFEGNNGNDPEAGIQLDAHGNLYGVTASGGADGFGTVFELASGSSTITALASFTANATDNVFSGVTVDTGGDVFGTMPQGGSSGGGEIYEVAAGSGSVTSLATFDSTAGKFPNGSAPSSLIINSSGNLYGTTASGGANSDGTLYELTQGSSSVNVLANFDSSDANPYGNVAVSGSMFYGTTYSSSRKTQVVFQATFGSLASQLAFSQQPQPAVTGAVLTPAVTVKVQDSGGNAVPSDNSSVTLSIASGPSGATLGGTVTAAAVNGVATFSNLTLATAGTYTLSASDGSLASGTSSSFVISSSGGGGGGGSSSLTPSIGGRLGSVAVAGQKFSTTQTVAFTNTSASPVSGDVMAALFLDAGTTLDANAIALPVSRGKGVHLKVGAHSALGLHLASIPGTVPAGTYHLLAEVTDPNGNKSVAAVLTTITVQSPVVTLAGAFAKSPASAKLGKVFTSTILITNNGNVPAQGTLTVNPYYSIDNVLDANAVVGVPIVKGIKLGAHKSQRVAIRLTAATAGSYYLLASVNFASYFSYIAPASTTIVTGGRVVVS